MMGQLDLDPIPPYAVTMWTNDIEIFVAMPMKDGGTPYIMSFAYSSDGLAKALRILHQRPKEIITPTHAQPANYTKPPVQPQVKLSKATERLHSETTPEQRAAAQDLLRKLGMIK
jgi:hypothetical protein